MDVCDVPSTDVEKTNAPTIDIGNLLLEDLDPVTVKSSGDCDGLKRLARDNVQCLFNEIWKLPTKRVEDAIVVDLPACTTRIPREKPMPRERPMTKWQEYAKEKGIANRKKSKLVWDDVSQQWKPRWGYRKNKVERQQNWMMEVPDNKDSHTDMFAEISEAKRERRAKNEMQRLRNMASAHGQGSAMTKDLDQIGRVPSGVGFSKEKQNPQDLARAMDRAKQSTASVGKFQPALKNEMRPKNRAKKHKFSPNEISSKLERGGQLKILQRINSSKPSIDKEKLVVDAKRNQQAGWQADGSNNAPPETATDDKTSDGDKKRKLRGRAPSNVARQTFFNSVKKGKLRQKHQPGVAKKATAQKRGGVSKGRGGAKARGRGR